MSRSKYVSSLQALALVGVFMALTACAPRTGIFDQDLDASLDEIVVWAEKNSDLVRPTSPRPAVAVTSKEEMAFHRGHSGVAAFYDPFRNVLWFNKDWRRDSVRDVGFALHEVAGHWMLLKATPRPRFACKQEREAEAYRLQALYYQQNDTSLERETGLTPERIKQLTTCE